MPNTLAPEVLEYRDRITGRTVRQLTHHKAHSQHLYFTNPGWFDGGRRLVFGSDRGNRTNLYSVELESGLITQHTDADMPGPPNETSFLFASLSPTRPEAYFWRGRQMIGVDLHTNREREIYRAPDAFNVNMTNVSADGKFVLTGLYEDLSHKFTVDLLNGYVGFKEYHDARPRSIIIAVPTDGGPAREVWAENYWIGHVNTSPTLPSILTFCHEGPWHEVDNRIWGLDISSGKVWPIRQRTSPREVVGHEYWHADGVHIGYHGETHRPQTLEAAPLGPAGEKIFGHVRYDDTEKFEVAFPHATGHVHSNSFELIVGDGMGDPGKKVIRLWKWNNLTGLFDGPRVLCEHRGSFQVQQLHVHPRFSPDGKKVVYTSDRTGYGQVYEVEIGDFETLPLLD